MKLDYVGSIIVNCSGKSVEIQDAITKLLSDAGYDFTARKDDKFAEGARRITLYRGGENGNNG